MTKTTTKELFDELVSCAKDKERNNEKMKQLSDNASKLTQLKAGFKLLTWHLKNDPK